MYVSDCPRLRYAADCEHKAPQLSQTRHFVGLVFIYGQSLCPKATTSFLLERIMPRDVHALHLDKVFDCTENGVI